MHRAFTLIELLVVITIIVVLLSILAPAMDQAVYQAELAVCGTRLKGIADGLAMYTVDYKHRFPHRPGASGDPGWKPNNIYVGSTLYATTGNPFEPIPPDDRRILKGYVELNGHLNDPLSPRDVDFEYSAPGTQIEVSYHLWYGWKYKGEKGMFRVGDRFEWTTTQPGDLLSPPTPIRTYFFDFLASDVDGMDAASKNTITGHQDNESRLSPQVVEDNSSAGQSAGLPGLGTGAAEYTFSRWGGETGRGTFDSQFVSSDTSVRRYVDVPYAPSATNPTMVRAPMWPSGYPFGQWQIQLGL